MGAAERPAAGALKFQLCAAVGSYPFCGPVVITQALPPSPAPTGYMHSKYHGRHCLPPTVYVNQLDNFWVFPELIFVYVF